jgi:HEAT repeat protein
MTLIFWFFFYASTPPSAASTVTDRAWTLLKQGTTDNSIANRAKAVHALGLAGLRTEGMADRALRDPEKQVRVEAAVALLEMKADGSRAHLRACLRDKEVQVVLSCANTLYHFKDPAAYEIYYAVLSGRMRSHEGLIASQMDMLRDRKEVEKLAFQTGIGFVPYGGEAWQAIRTVTHDDSSTVRALAAERLADDPSKKSGEILASYVIDKSPQVRDAVVTAIVHRGDPALLNSVETLLDDDDLTVRYDAAAAVIRLAEGKRGAGNKH